MIMPREGGRAALTFQRNLQRRKRSTQRQPPSITAHPRATAPARQDHLGTPASAAQPGHRISHPPVPQTGVLPLRLCQRVSQRRAAAAPVPAPGLLPLLLGWHKWSLPGGQWEAARDGNHVPSTGRGWANIALHAQNPLNAPPLGHPGLEVLSGHGGAGQSQCCSPCSPLPATSHGARHACTEKPAHHSSSLTSVSNLPALAVPVSPQQ